MIPSDFCQCSPSSISFLSLWNQAGRFLLRTNIYIMNPLQCLWSLILPLFIQHFACVQSLALGSTFKPRCYKVKHVNSFNKMLHVSNRMTIITIRHKIPIKNIPWNAFSRYYSTRHTIPLSPSLMVASHIVLSMTQRKAEHLIVL